MLAPCHFSNRYAQVQFKMRPIHRVFFIQENLKSGRMLGLVVTIDKPTSEKIVRRRSYRTDIAGNPGGGVSHGRHFHFRYSLYTVKGKRRRKTDLISIKMLGGHVQIVRRHSEK